MTASPHGARTIDFRYAPPVAFTSICRPDDPYKTLVRQDGTLLYDFRAPSFESWHFRRVIEFRLRSRGGPQKIRQVTESARIPVVVTSSDVVLQPGCRLAAQAGLHPGAYTGRCRRDGNKRRGAR